MMSKQELKTRDEVISASSVNRGLGVEIKSAEMARLVEKMGLKSRLDDDYSDRIHVTIPATRQDILHSCDIMEDVGIAFGYNNIKMTFPKAVTVGHQLPLNKVADQIRFEIARCGYTEALTFALVSD